MLKIRLMAIAWLINLSPQAAVADGLDMAQVFSVEHANKAVLQVEAALALSQADFGVIPQWAADEIKAKASLDYLPAADLAAEYGLVRHRMVALLNVWSRELGAAAQYVHFGATTVDIYDTTLVLQLLDATALLEARLLSIEAVLARRALEHKATPMIGRTLGQHALPITFGKKLSTWLAENRRNIERLRSVRAKLQKSAILKGAVGSYLGLGSSGIGIEQRFAFYLGLQEPYLADWHGTRDVFAEYALVLALISRSYGRIGQELFLLQSTDIGETVERRSPSAVGSSTMPHKNNPNRSEALIQFGRSIPRLAEVVLDDVDNFFERDNTSRPNKVLEQISLESDQMLAQAEPLLARLEVKPQRMVQNMARTNQLIMSQRLAFALAEQIGKQVANDRLHVLASQALADNVSLREVFLASDLARLISVAQLDALLEPTTYIGLAIEQTEGVVGQIEAQRQRDGVPSAIEQHRQGN